jgi:hypothetical protein
MSWTDFITPSSDTESRSGLYAVDLPGVVLNLFDDLTKEDQADWEECWASIYSRATRNFTKDVHARIAKDFHVDLKLVTRESSKFRTSENTNSGYAGIKLNYYLPKYARVRVNEVIVNAVVAVNNFSLVFYEEDTSGDLLLTKTVNLVQGKNTIQINQDFEVEDTLFVGYDADSFRLYETINRYYANTPYFHFDDIACAFPCYGGSLSSSITQILGGGVNVKSVIYCSIEKFIFENIGLFDMSLLYRIGVELMKERITSAKFNRLTTLTTERAGELMTIYREEYEGHLDTIIKNMSMDEDPICFECKSAVSSKSLIP